MGSTAFDPHRWDGLRDVLVGMLGTLKVEEPERFALVMAEVNSPEWRGLAITRAVGGWCTVWAGDIEVGRFHLGVLRDDSASCN